MIEKHLAAFVLSMAIVFTGSATMAASSMPKAQTQDIEPAAV